MKPVWSEMSFEAISFAKINFIWKAKKNNVKVKLILQEKYYSWQNISYEIQGKIMYKKRFHLKILSSGKLNNQIREAWPSRKKQSTISKLPNKCWSHVKSPPHDCSSKNMILTWTQKYLTQTSIMKGSISYGKQKRKTGMQKLYHLKHISCTNISCEM